MIKTTSYLPHKIQKTTSYLPNSLFVCGLVSLRVLMQNFTVKDIVDLLSFGRLGLASIDVLVNRVDNRIHPYETSMINDNHS